MIYERMPQILGHQFWLGGSDWATEGKWIWEPKGEAFNFTNWLRGQPNNGDNNQHCLMLNTQDNYHWRDHDCHDALHYICENA
jgi:hypothetical protein